MIVTLDGMDGLREDLKAVVDKYPDVAADALQKSGKKFKSAVIKETYRAVDKKTGNLQKGYELDPVKIMPSEMSVDFRAKAKHFHLIENGHNQVTQKTRKKKILRNGGRVIGFVPGRLIVAATREKYRSEFPEIVSAEIDKLLQENGLV